MKTCEDMEKEGKWKSNKCCDACHDESDSDHRLSVESIGGEQVRGCIPLFEHLLYGFAIEDTSA